MKQLLSVADLSVTVINEDRQFRVVSHVSFGINVGETLTVIGESGCGKTTLALALIGLGRPGSKITIDGSIEFDGTKMASAGNSVARSLRGKAIAFVSQNPQSSFDPIMTIGQQMREVLKIHTKHLSSEFTELIVNALQRVGIAAPKSRIDDYPHQFSGGMLQRVTLATALLVSPRLLIADEPTSALDVTVQAQILDLLLSIQSEHNMSIMMITHDLGVASRVSDQIAVMYAGQFVEIGSSRSVLTSPRMPYTQGLIAATPRYKGSKPARVTPIAGTPPVLGAQNLPACSFYDRCRHHQEVCRSEVPLLRLIQSEHQDACHLDVNSTLGITE